MSKRYPIVKRVALGGYSEGWDESCFAMIVPATYEDRKALLGSTVKEGNEAELIDLQIKVVKEHFVSGTINVFDGKEFTPSDMTVDDAVASSDLADYLYSEIMGLGLDPKDIRAVVQRETSPKTEQAATATS